MIWTLKCETCERVLGTVAEVKHLELECPRCQHKTTFTTYSHHGNPRLSAIHVPKSGRRVKDKPESIDHMMRSNRYVDPKKC